MAEKMVMTSWDFIELICAEHLSVITLSATSNTLVYICNQEGCSTKLPSYVHEKILADIVKKYNDNSLVIGESWRKKYLNRFYEFKVKSFVYGKKVQISVKCMGV